LSSSAPLLRDYEALLHKIDLNTQELEQLQLLQDQIEHADAWTLQQKVHTVLSQLDLEGSETFSNLSGGIKRRVLLAQALVSEPDILLLDEPTNHLDIAAVQWLETFLPSLKSSILFITHDRMFLQNVATRIIELDRGKLFSYECRYHEFLAMQNQRLAIEQRENELFDKEINKEETWIRQGIKARRTRNEGRVRSLEAMREQLEQRRKLQGRAKLFSAMAPPSGKRVIKAHNISLSLGGKTLFTPMNIEIVRGDKIGVLGPNGCGKSTLIRVLLHDLQPDTGTIKHGTELKVAYFDQLRGELDSEKSVMDNVSDGASFIPCNGKDIHIYSYLRRYLFEPDRARTLVKHLSGGERNRCLLARVLSKPSNFLILDEPSKDLDLYTLELLEELLVDYTGTLIVVSHDREFINQVAKRTICFEGEAQVKEYVGGYDDWQRQKTALLSGKPKDSNQKSTSKLSITASSSSPGSSPRTRGPNQKGTLAMQASSSKKMTFKDQHRLQELPKLIDALDAKIAAHHAEMAEPDFYTQAADIIKTHSEQLEKIEVELKKLYQEWEGLEK
jgi:ATP-binding cassette subfamily F protein uup